VKKYIAARPRLVAALRLRQTNLEPFYLLTGNKSRDNSQIEATLLDERATGGLALFIHFSFS
jgi:hypothetical protein